MNDLVESNVTALPAAKPPVGGVLTPMALLQIAVDRGADIAQLERLWALHREVEADQARKAYHEAMAQFKVNPPSIAKDKHVAFETQKGVTEYDHATLGNVVRQITAALSPHGLSAGWSIERREARVFVTCTVTHRLGYSQSVTLDCAPDDSGGKNNIQAVGSAITYLQRYTLLAILGLAAEDRDDDGAGYTEPQPQAGPQTWPSDSFSKQFARWQQAVEQGVKTKADILALARSKGALTPEQERAINELQEPAK